MCSAGHSQYASSVRYHAPVQHGAPAAAVQRLHRGQRLEAGAQRDAVLAPEDALAAAILPAAAQLACAWPGSIAKGGPSMVKVLPAPVCPYVALRPLLHQRLRDDLVRARLRGVGPDLSSARVLVRGVALPSPPAYVPPGRGALAQALGEFMIMKAEKGGLGVVSPVTTPSPSPFCHFGFGFKYRCCARLFVLSFVLPKFNVRSNRKGSSLDGEPRRATPDCDRAAVTCRCAGARLALSDDAENCAFVAHW
jgi:hypothetical protein